MPRAY